MNAESSPEGWHPDPTGAFELRYWDGNVWTAHVWKDGVQSMSELPTAPQPTVFAEAEVPTQEVLENTSTIEAAAVCENGHPLSDGLWECPQCGARIRMQWMDDSASASAVASKRADPKTDQRESSVESAETSPGQQRLILAGWLAAYSVAGLVVWRLCTVILTNGSDEESSLFSVVELAFGRLFA